MTGRGRTGSINVQCRGLATMIPSPNLGPLLRRNTVPQPARRTVKTTSESRSCCFHSLPPPKKNYWMPIIKNMIMCSAWGLDAAILIKIEGVEKSRLTYCRRKPIYGWIISPKGINVGCNGAQLDVNTGAWKEKYCNA